MSLKNIYFIIPVLLLMQANFIRAQSFGFGCLGFVGGYAGYSYQKYNPEGLNEYVGDFNYFNKDSLSIPMNNFGTFKGYRVGLNFFRAHISNFILTAKGFYESLNEKHEAVEKFVNGTRTTDLELNYKNWGVGLDLGITITDLISWKIVDGAVRFNNISLTNTTNFTGGETQMVEYKNAKTSIGYSIGTGFILAIIEDYVSLEGTAGYTMLSIDQVQNSKGEVLALANSTEKKFDAPVNNFIKSGGFNAVVQLNLGFPL